jgi:hypothetical protein
LLIALKKKIGNNITSFDINNLIEKFDILKNDLKWGESYAYAFAAQNGFSQATMMDLIQKKRLDASIAIKAIASSELNNKKILFTNTGNIKKIISKINQIKGKYYFFDGNNFFILIDDVIFGLNINFLELTTITENKIKSWLKSKEFEIFDKKQIFNVEEININHNTHLIPPIHRENIYEKEFIIGYILE